ncbi:M3 family metallopeptidase [Flavobacterium sp. xlx-214]|uniref:M3 family metallopeptidase n=1 Tax=unclassified Flavobacterium TaxID=196869 RepID=UPI0013D8A9C4|nr:MULTISPECIES: M3 family metallopeptidase [unclassified Flavobacterium]MBA5792330.1 M3 family metallopeptidase [Flavobacterium sp. xlx-221]QMI82355.1 M3 family metallopeptidase [Flavobacterium sp. xlx-214]
MNRKTLLILTTILGITTQSCKKENTAMISGNENPLIAEWNTPFEVPPFDKIKNEDFKPAILEGIKDHEKDIKAIVDAKDAPTFENVIVALDNSGDVLSKVTTVLYNLTSANTNDTLQKLAQEMAPTLSEHNDNIYLNDALFKKVKAVYDQYQIAKPETLQLTTEQQMLLNETYKRFVRSGANLSQENKEKLKKYNSELSVLSLKYGDNLLNETNNYELVIDNKENLAGLPQELIDAASADAKAKGKDGKWVFTLSNSSVMPFLQYASNRKLRETMLNAYQMRGNQNNGNDNKEITLKLVNLRMLKAQLLGYKNHAEYVLEESMAKNPDAVNNILMKLWTPALEKAKKEATDIQEMMRKEGINEDVTPADWRYYTEKIRKERYNLDEQELKPYFSLENVRKGIFDVTNKLWGLTYKELKNVPKYHEDVTVWEVFDANKKTLGLLYMDMHPRASKRGGAWMTSFRDQQMENGKRKVPVISIVCNFTKPTATTPSLLTFDETTTFFHEFGHALHGLLSNVNYKSLAGTNVPRDFVELPSQVMENWAAEPEVLKMYAKHYKTGEVIPDTLIEKMKAAGTFDQGFATTEYLAASLLDMQYHTATTEIKDDINTFELNAMKKVGLIDAIIPRYRSTYFSHIFAGGYSAGYYSYIWSAVLDTDAFQAFKETSLFNPEKAKLFRENVLEKGGTEDPAVLYRKFRGADPKIEPLLKKRGLN